MRVLNVSVTSLCRMFTRRNENMSIRRAMTIAQNAAASVSITVEILNGFLFFHVQ